MSNRGYRNQGDQYVHTIGVAVVQRPPRYDSHLIEPGVHITKTIAIDCEMVGVGPRGRYSMLARVSLVNSYGQVILDTYVAPTQTVTNYRTQCSGIRADHLRNAPCFAYVRQTVADVIEDKILVGHALHYDLDALELQHPHQDIRDTSVHYQHRYQYNHTPSLKNLASEFLNLTMQVGSHDSIDDARAAMRLYNRDKDSWYQPTTFSNINSRHWGW